MSARKRDRASTSRLLATALAGVLVAIGATWLLLPKPTPASPQFESPTALASIAIPAPHPLPALPDPRPDCQVISCVALTFDDGPDRISTSRLLDVLEERRAPATFFVLGHKVAGHEDVLYRMVRLGMQVENHTWDHPNLRHLSHGAVIDQIRRTNDEIARVTGRHPEHLRPPFGDWAPGVTPTDGLSMTTWDVDPSDWLHRNRDQVVQNTLSAVRPGAIVLLHDIHPSTIDAIPAILDGLESQGLVPATLNDLLFNDTPLHG